MFWMFLQQQEIFSVKEITRLFSRTSNAIYSNYKTDLIRDQGHVRSFLKQVEAQKGEGVVLRNPNAPYERKRSSQILKLKTALDEECENTAHHKGKTNLKTY